MILFISRFPNFPEFKDGATIRVKHLLKEYAKIGAVDFCFVNVDSICYDVSMLPKGVDLINIPVNKLDKFLIKIAAGNFWATSVRSAIKRVVHSKTYDYIVLEGENLMTAVPRDVLRVSNVNFIDPLSFVFIAAWRTKRFNPIYLYKAIVSFCMEFIYSPRAGARICVAASDARLLEELVKKKVLVSPNGVDRDQFFRRQNKVKNQELGINALFVGNMSGFMNKEGALCLLEIFGSISENAGVKLRIVGQNIPVSFYKYESNNIEFFADVDSVSPYYEAADFFVCPVVFGRGIKNSVIQAMAYDLPIIIHEKYQDDHFLDQSNAVFFSDRDELAAIVKYVVDRDWSIDNEHLFVEKLNWRRCAEESLQVSSA